MTIAQKYRPAYTYEDTACGEVKRTVLDFAPAIIQPVAITPEQCTFSPANGCHLPVSLNGIWE